MLISSPTLSGLVTKLDSLANNPSLLAIADALGEAHLTCADVEPYVKTSPHNYTRATVVLRDHYELLVLTWQGGQASVPHDHGGSVCAMMTMRGTAVEGNYTVASDGYVDLEYETEFPTGQITAGADQLDRAAL